MKIKTLSVFLCLSCFVVVTVFSQQKTEKFPTFEFGIWGSAPSRVITLTGERVVQKMLFAIKERALSAQEIAEKIGEKEPLILEKLGELEQYTVVKEVNGKWISNIPLYVEKEIREAEKIGLKYAEKEASILRRAIPGLKRLYGETTVSRHFSWDAVSLILVGAFLADFCVVDRIPFMPGNSTQEMRPWLGKEGEAKWGYTGFETLPKTYPSRRWRFYQNVTSEFSGGGARFGYYRDPDERRKSPPSHPENLFAGTSGRILFALADGPLGFDELENRSRLEDATLRKALDQLSSYRPPAVIFKDGKYEAKIPIISGADFKLLLPALDKIAEEIFKVAILQDLKERTMRARELGYRWPLPADTYVRDRALQILIEEGLLCCVQEPPVDWNFNVWGWKGFLPMHEEITKGVKPPEPDSFLRTPVSAEEKKTIEEFQSIKGRILKGEKFLDTSTPARAFLTRMSGWYHSDVEALKAVEVPWDSIKEGIFEESGSRRWANDMIQLNIRRIHLPEREPKDGDAVPIFSTGGDSGGTYVYFYYHGTWRVLYNTQEEEEYWNAYLEEILKSKLGYLEERQKK